MLPAASWQWCVHPRLVPGEALSWWLHRFAWANAISNHALAARIVIGRAFWPRDVDRFASREVLACLAVQLGADENALAQATLHRFEGTLFPRLTTSGWLPWVTPVGVYHRIHRHHGHAFCPRCLGEGRPLLIAGRVAYEVACSRHQCALEDACPQCDAPVTFARMSLAQVGRYRCPHCGFNLAVTSSHQLNQLAKAFEHRCHRVLRRGRADLAGRTVCACEFFQGTRILLRGLYARARLNGVTDCAARHALRWPRRLPRPSTPFEHWRVVERMRALGALEAYLEDWPESFLRDAQRGHVYRCRFENRGPVTSPHWVVDALDQLAPSRNGSGGFALPP